MHRIFLIFARKNQTLVLEISSVFQTIYQNLLTTSLPEFIAVIFGLLSVWFARKENIWVYPTGIINVLIYVYLCFHAGLYADMGINAFYFIMSVYGWYKWTHRDQQDHQLPITALTKKQWILNLAATVLFFFLLRFILIRFTDSKVPDLDSFTTALFIIGMWLMATKKLENWIFWIVGDAMVIPLFAYKGLAFTGVQYLVFLVLAVMGYAEWKKRLNNPALL
jgi:nicotinamide mononucleotide transporter